MFRLIYAQYANLSRLSKTYQTLGVKPMQKYKIVDDGDDDDDDDDDTPCHSSAAEPVS